ncbi:aldo/keto reductase [Murimonas intestini]|uniref:Aryl-alcohol dehydrogenase-like predicted oxidoreductase n=1 Tax=Murimonas intestini TaxID=1337051 RepID=A0AB73TAD7_9FIRM|nr:aldo/keto reductase [Murimonas intestini]MCR1838949.1 aldo/keto reductase [Murimonas intestini]MCR1864245.1 aldo/keto reductase [Murimonas intestini]MCR1881855.1 aldo/keto reductase [Murimonas intestini]
MQYQKIPYVKKPVSRILFGTAMAPFTAGGDGNELLDAMYGLGVNTFDAARNYGLAERSFGNWLETRENRNEIVILSKCGHPSVFGRKRVNETEMRKDLKKSLSNLRTDYIDIYMLHRDDPEVEAGEVVEIFNAMHAEGKIGAFGGSNWTHERIAEANEYAYKHSMTPFSVSSPNFSLADQVKDPWGGGCITISGPANKGAREWYKETQMPVIAYSSLGRGFFSGKLKSADEDCASKILDSAAMKGYAYPENFERLKRCEELAAEKGVSVPQIAMAWIFRQNMNTFAVVSTSRPERMKENIHALDISLSEEEAAYLDLACPARNQNGNKTNRRGVSV